MSRALPESPVLFEQAPRVPDDRFERDLMAQGCQRVAGVDEAGRGPLAGPVVAAAVVLDPDRPISGLADSKALTARQREHLFDEIMAKAAGVAIASASAETIDRTDILKASLVAMARALHGLIPATDGALIDGNRLPDLVSNHMVARAIIKGDARCVSIAAASIVAKVARDRMMVMLCQAHPAYRLSGHKGYGSAHHRQMIARHGGVRRLHRFSFRPLKQD